MKLACQNRRAGHDRQGGRLTDILAESCHAVVDRLGET